MNIMSLDTPSGTSLLLSFLWSVVPTWLLWNLWSGSNTERRTLDVLYDDNYLKIMQILFKFSPGKYIITWRMRELFWWECGNWWIILALLLKYVWLLVTKVQEVLKPTPVFHQKMCIHLQKYKVSLTERNTIPF